MCSLFCWSSEGGMESIASASLASSGARQLMVDTFEANDDRLKYF